MEQNILNHIDNLENNLGVLSFSQRGKFAAWCVHALASDAHIIKHLALLTQSNMALDLIHHSIQLSWKCSDDTANIQALKKLATITWDESSELADDEWTQGCIELLGATHNMLLGLVENNISLQANCAERVINWMDYLNDFELLEEESVIANEYRIQNQFLDDLMRDVAVDLQKYRK